MKNRSTIFLAAMLAVTILAFAAFAIHNANEYRAYELTITQISRLINEKDAEINELIAQNEDLGKKLADLSELVDQLTPELETLRNEAKIKDDRIQMLTVDAITAGSKLESYVWINNELKAEIERLKAGGEENKLP